MSALRDFLVAVRADHDQIVLNTAKYGRGKSPAGRLWVDAVRKIGFQIMIAYRAMRLLRTWRVPVLPQIVSRLMRHLYASDIHWDASFEPGVMIVHGMGLCISHSARVASGVVLFQGVTLGEGIDPVTREIGSPVVERDVHVGAGATLVGPIRIGAGSKIAASVVLMRSVPERSLVEAHEPLVRPRPARPSPAATPDRDPDTAAPAGTE
jgi:serine O-acetyltransferase